jgi:hypothetical protein
VQVVGSGAFFAFASEKTAALRIATRRTIRIVASRHKASAAHDALRNCRRRMPAPGSEHDIVSILAKPAKGQNACQTLSG